MEEKVTEKQIQIMHKFSIVAYVFLGIMILFAYFLTNYYPSLTKMTVPGTKTKHSKLQK